MRVKTIGIVSLSSGILGEPFIKHEVELGLGRLSKLGLTVKFLPHALKGLDYTREHPEKRAGDLLEAFRDPEIDMILCAIGGDDTYRLLPYLFDHDELRRAVADSRRPGAAAADNQCASDKIFLGFSDTTINHLMLHKVGLKSFYGQSFLADICELSPEMLPYSRKYFEELVRTGAIREITPSDLWYEERKSFSESEAGKPLTGHRDSGFELLQGPAVFSGRILGGCIDSLHDFFDGTRYADMPAFCGKYHLFPEREDWRGRILLLESSEEKMHPEKYRKSLEYLKATSVFDVVNGVLAGKPMDNAYAKEYKEALAEVIGHPDLSVVWNINVGHAQPRCIIPFGVEAHVDAEKQVIRFEE